MFQETVPIQVIDNLHIEPLVLKYLQVHVTEMTFLVLEVFIVIETSILIKLHHVQATPSSITNEKTLDLPDIPILETIATVLFLDATQETYSI